MTRGPFLMRDVMRERGQGQRDLTSWAIGPRSSLTLDANVPILQMLTFLGTVSSTTVDNMTLYKTT